MFFPSSDSLNDLNPNTSYELLNIKVSINDKEYNVDSSTRIVFKTLKQSDSIVKAMVGSTTIESTATTNTITIELDQMLPINIGKEIRALFNNSGVNLYSQTVLLVKDKLDYSLQILNIDARGFDKIVDKKRTIISITKSYKRTINPFI